ncbi:MAG: glycosyltransferase family 39 protein [Deltaproteobacteria bacterium]|nr:glycosyltransferase family 39 protein [Deltaproteobacteria bacterium]MBW2418484.1 glycosyltransferase family 39 protein [Deltaproteobacteria bacterium]
MLALLALAAWVRVYAWQQTTALFNDGPIFLYIAEAMGEGDWQAVFQHPYHPLYPLAVAALGSWVGDLEQAAVLVSIATGTAAVGMLYLFLREAFAEREAWIGAGILALHPTFVDFSSDVQSEGLYVLCFLAAVWLIWRGLSRGEARWAALGGLAVGLAYLVRPEGLLLCVPVAGLAGYQLLRKRWRPVAALAWMGAFTAGMAIAAVPYVFAIRGVTGQWAITQKYSAIQVAALARSGEAAAPGWSVAERARTGALDAGAGSATPSRPGRAPRTIPLVEVAPRLGAPPPEAPKSAIARALRALDELSGAAVSGLRFSLLPFVLIGVVAGWGSFGLRDGYLAAIAGCYGLVLFGLALGAGYVSRRHALPPLLPALGYAAVGVPIVGGILLDLGRGRRPAPRPAGGGRYRAAALLGFAIILLFAVPRDLRERRSSSLGQRRAAEWLREQPHTSGAVAAGHLRIAYYAGETFVPIPAGGEGEDILIYLQKRGVRYLIIDDKRLQELGGLREAVGRELRLLHRSETRGDDVAVYRVADREAP